MLFPLERFGQAVRRFVKVGEGTYKGIRGILKVFYGFRILSDVVVFHSVMRFKTLQFPKWRKSILRDSTDLHKRNLLQQQESQTPVCIQKNINLTS